ncbi:MAG TPA: alpha/beta fold hydrolase [Actinomycetota bacterium]
MAGIMKGAEPWGHEGDDVGVLVLHGFTGSPQSVRTWAEGIAREGHTVIVPRLPGHGTSVEDLQHTTPADWVGEAEMALRGLQERCRSIFVCGLSAGGSIAFDLAARLGDRLSGIVTVNGLLFSRDPRVKLAPLLGKLPLKLKGVASDIADPAQAELAYGKVPTKASAALLAWLDGVKRSLGSITTPALIFTARQDHVVHPDNGPYALEHISSTDKELVWLERSYHVATLDYDKDEILQRTVTFIKERAS